MLLVAKYAYFQIAHYHVNMLHIVTATRKTVLIMGTDVAEVVQLVLWDML